MTTAELFDNIIKNSSPLVFLFILVVLFFIFREVVNWFWKINEQIKLQKETNRLLRKIAGEPELEEEKKNESSVKEGTNAQT